MQPDHTKLLNQAVKRFFAPLGVRQRGRSRLWYDDHGWWLVVVEFQPGWAAGSYLNVGAMWLWMAKDHFSFDDGYRVEPFARFDDESQFSSVADSLAIRAVKEVERYRMQFPSVQAVATHLISKANKDLWDSFHAGIACALCGRTTDALRSFEEVSNTTDSRDWALRAATIAKEHSASLNDPIGFKHRVKDIVVQTRQTLKLDPLTDVTFC